MELLNMNILFVFFISTIAVVGKTWAENLADEEINEVERIVGGSSAQKGMFPYAAALFHDNRFVCTASIISERSIMTAAHCVVFNGTLQLASDFHAIIGNIDKSASQTKVKFSSIIVHPQYVYTNLLNDIAILTTMEEIKFNNEIKRICLASSKIKNIILKSVIAMGWGIKTRDLASSDTSDILRYTKLRVYPNTKCSILYLDEVPKTILCAGGFNTGVCAGDSGGPLVLNLNREHVQVGVASFVSDIFGCARLLGPAGFSRVSSYNEFIAGAAKGNVCFLPRSSSIWDFFWNLI